MSDSWELCLRPSLSDAFVCVTLNRLISSSLPQVEVLVDLYFYLIAFCREQEWPGDKVSTLASIMYVVVKEDRKNGFLTMEGSFDNFKRLLLAHCVDRPPVSVAVFSEKDAQAIVDYVTDSYFRHHRLYKFALSARPAMQLTQVAPNGVQSPGTIRPLAEGITEALEVDGDAPDGKDDGDDGDAEESKE